MSTNLTFVHALAPLHAGTGQGVGVIDLPIAREKATGLPFLPGSSLKGTLRDACPEADRRAVFGPERDSAADHAGAAQFSDQRLLLLPIRSLAGTFAWVTSPYLLHRFARDAQDRSLTGLPQRVPSPDKTENCIIAPKQQDVQSQLLSGQQVILEDLELQPTEQSTERKELAEWMGLIGKYVFPGSGGEPWRRMLTERICLVHDDVLTFLLATATEITARVSLMEQTKTVSDGGLWYEEALPAETILSGLVLTTRALDKQNGKTETQVLEVIKGLTGKTMQFGGKATVGRGLCRVQIA